LVSGFIVPGRLASDFVASDFVASDFFSGFFAVGFVASDFVAVDFFWNFAADFCSDFVVVDFPDVRASDFPARVLDRFASNFLAPDFSAAFAGVAVAACGLDSPASIGRGGSGSRRSVICLLLLC
jgi:hypothetical protein